MKTILNPSQYTFNPTANQIDFSAVSGGFIENHLYAVIDVTTGKLIYAVASAAAGYDGTFAGSVLTYVSSNAGQANTDVLQVIYDDPNYSQLVSGTVGVNGTVQSNLFDGSGTYPILSTTDIVSGKEGLDINLLNSSYGGQINLVLPSPFENNALSTAFLNPNTGILSSPNMDPMTNNLKVDIDNISSSTTLPVTIAGSSVTISESLDYWQGNAVSITTPVPQQIITPSASPQSYGQGATDANTQRVAANQYTSSGQGLDYGAGLVSNNTTRVTSTDYNVSGPSGITGINSNLLSGGTSAFATDSYRFATIQINSTATSGSYIFEGSNDNSTFFNVPVYNSLNPNALPILGNITATNSSIGYQVPITFRWLKVRISSALTGGSAQTYSRFSQAVPNFLYNTGASIYNPATNPATDVMNTPIVASKYNQIEIDFNTAPSSSVLTTTTAGGATITQANGHTLFTTGTTTTASAKAVSVGVIQYRPANEIYSYFTASFTTPTSANSYQRIGMYDTNNGFFIGYNGTNWGVTKRTAAVDTFTIRSLFNGDPLDGTTSSKFTRNGIPEAINFTLSNLFRIRYAWLGSGSILFDIFSPDGLWINFHSIKQPNSALNPSLTIPNVPITLDVAKASADTTSLTMATACWAGGTTSPYQPITATLTDNTLATVGRSVITGVTTGGGGGYVNVKVNPSGALVGDFSNSTGLGVSSLPSIPAGSNNIGSITNITGTVSLPTGASTEATLSAINTKTPALGQTTMSASQPVVIASDQSNLPANIKQINGSTLNIGQQTMAASVPVVLPSDMGNMPMISPDLYVTGQSAQTATVNNILTVTAGTSATDVSGYRSASVQVVSTGTAGTFIFEGANDNVNFQAIPVFNQSVSNPSFISGAITASASQIIYTFPIAFRYVRLRIATTITGGSIQAFSRFSQATWSTGSTVVSQTTGSNLNAAVTGSLTTVSTVTTVASVTSDNLASSTTNDITSGVITTTTTSGNIATTNIQSVAFQIAITAVSGTTPTLDVVIQETMDGINYYDIYHYERITATGNYFSPVMKLAGIGFRYVRTVTGTTPSFTMSAIRITRAGNAPTIRRVFDRTMNPNTLGSSSPSILTAGCDTLHMVISLGTGGSGAQPHFRIQGSEDNTVWYDFSTTDITVNNSTTLFANYTGALPRYSKMTVQTAGASGYTLIYGMLTSKGN